ncbi:protein phosphatase 2c [Diplodia corticola]|uniref:Protein phosphatase 2c n=1 Tax=Diplodia corticola TaxID=236234 RepID=A0A1J9QZQ5_9PEZI|nr:protein phosphatase 2c [Diplodia corticola]OJD34582.1 protein phosphatase 2c [Diplodia corticola]
MPLPTPFLKKVLGVVSSRSSPASRRLLSRPPPSRFRHARVSPVATVVGGAAAVTGVAAYLLQPSTASKDHKNATIFVPQIKPLKRNGDAAADNSNSNIVQLQSPVKALDVADANEVLRREERSKLFDAGNGQVGRCDLVRVPSNSPVEDEFVTGTQAGPGGNPWTFWGVFDGHAGWATSVLLREALVPMVSDHLERLPAHATSPQISTGISQAFLAVDDAINRSALAAMNDPEAHPGSAQVVSAIAPAIAGSCALLAAYDPVSTTLRVACTGDSRAVLGRAINHDGSASCKPRDKYAAVALSRDQTGKNDDEYARLVAAHPGEAETMINRESGRLLGLAVTRAFGDHRWKWREGDITEAQQKYWSSAPRPNSKSPPYLTAEPVVEETRIQVGTKRPTSPAPTPAAPASNPQGGEPQQQEDHHRRGDFLILASDGFWDHISNEDAVECVARWLDAKRADALRGTPADALKKMKKMNPRHADDADDDEHWWLDEGRYVEWRATPEFFVAEDDNAATHLVRNAFGGARRSLFCGVVTAYPPISRNVRDDTTVQVVFFGDV